MGVELTSGDAGLLQLSSREGVHSQREEGGLGAWGGRGREEEAEGGRVEEAGGRLQGTRGTVPGGGTVWVTL